MKIRTFNGNSEELVDVLCTLEERIFDEPYSREKIERECSVKYNLLALVGYQQAEPVAYKVGYELTARLYYSWLGGVVPEHRNKGLARRLMQQQHKKVQGMGYKAVRTHTHNKYKDMLVLNIRSGFEIVGVLSDSSNPETTIVLDKQLV